MSKESRPVIIFGNGSMARVLYSYMKKDFDVAAFCVDRTFIKEENFLNKPIVPFEDIESKYSPDKYVMINSIGFIQMNKLREIRSVEAQQKGYELISYIDESVKIHNNVTIGKNCIILDYVSIHPNTSIEDGTFISSNVNIGHDCKIGKYNWINSGVSIAGFVNVGERCFWGVNSSSGNNISIGKENYIAANTMIAKNTDDADVYISQPAEKIRLKSDKFLKFIG